MGCMEGKEAPKVRDPQLPRLGGPEPLAAVASGNGTPSILEPCAAGALLAAGAPPKMLGGQAGFCALLWAVGGAGSLSGSSGNTSARDTFCRGVLEPGLLEKTEGPALGGRRWLACVLAAGAPRVRVYLAIVSASASRMLICRD